MWSLCNKQGITPSSSGKAFLFRVTVLSIFQTNLLGLHSEHWRAPSGFMWSDCNRQGTTQSSSGKAFPISGNSSFKRTYSDGLKQIPFVVGTTWSPRFPVLTYIRTRTVFSDSTVHVSTYVILIGSLLSKARSIYSNWLIQFFHRIRVRLMPFFVGFHFSTSWDQSETHPSIDGLQRTDHSQDLICT